MNSFIFQHSVCTGHFGKGTIPWHQAIHTFWTDITAVKLLIQSADRNWNEFHTGVFLYWVGVLWTHLYSLMKLIACDFISIEWKSYLFLIDICCTNSLCCYCSIKCYTPTSCIFDLAKHFYWLPIVEFVNWTQLLAAFCRHYHEFCGNVQNKLLFNLQTIFAFCIFEKTFGAIVSWYRSEEHSWRSWRYSFFSYEWRSRDCNAVRGKGKVPFNRNIFLPYIRCLQNAMNNLTMRHPYFKSKIESMAVVSHSLIRSYKNVTFLLTFGRTRIFQDGTFLLSLYFKTPFFFKSWDFLIITYFLRLFSMFQSLKR